MGLITKEVNLSIGGKNISYLRDKGYILPTTENRYGRLIVPKGSTVKVKVEDLMPNSSVFVDIKCDYCNKIFKRRYYQYTASNHNGKFYCKNCSSKAQLSGTKSPSWNSSIDPKEREINRNYQEYHDFIKRVLTRDNYTCQCCGKQINHNAEVHHLDGYNWCIEKRTDDTNGITLCSTCHSNFHSIYGKGNNTKNQFEEWINKTVELLHYDGEISSARKVYCIENKTIYKNAKDVANTFNVDVSLIYFICEKIKYQLKDGTYVLKYKNVKGKHFLWYDDFLNMSKEDIDKYLLDCSQNNKYKSVICLTTNEVFAKVIDASKKYGIKNSSNIIQCCKGINKTAGTLDNGIKLTWAYL